MANHNCLEGYRCPDCKSEGPFSIRASATFVVSDDGTDSYSDVEWNGDDSCRCMQCQWSGEVSDFQYVEEYADPEYTSEYACPTCYARMSCVVEANVRRCKCGEEFTV